jgi:hypothetical protein
MFADLDDHYDLISYFRLDKAVNNENFQYLKKLFTNKKNNEKIEKLLIILTQDDFSHYNNIFLQYFSFYGDIPFYKKFFNTNINIYKYRFISLIIDKNIDALSLLLDNYNINQIKFYLNSDKDYDNNYLKIINNVDDEFNSNKYSKVLIKLITNNYDYVKNLNFNILHLISIKDNSGIIFNKIIQIYKKEDIKEPKILLFNCLQKKIIYYYSEHNKNILFFYNNFTKDELNINHLKQKYEILFLEYIKLITINK